MVLLVGLMCINMLRAQTLIDNYRFSTRVDTTAWIDISGVDSVLIAAPDSGRVLYGASPVTGMGFTFPFGGTGYTQFSVNISGVLRLGSSRVPQNNVNSPLSQSALMPSVIIYGSSGEMDSTCRLRYATLGTEGNHVLVVEARIKVRDSDSSYVSWQEQFYEATGEVLIVYGSSMGTDGVSATQPGLARTASDILFVDYATHSAQRLASRTQVPTNEAGVWPERGRCYSFVPDMAVCPYPPEVTATSTQPDSVRLAWGGVFGGTAWRLEIPLAGIDTVLTDTSFIFGGLEPYVDFTGTLQSICGGDSSLRQRPFNFTTGCGTIHLLPWSDNFMAAVTNDCWLKPYKTSGNRWQRLSANNNYYMRAGYSTTSSTVYNEWLISPPVELPDTVGLTLSWWYANERYNGRAPKVRVRVLVCDTLDEVDTTAAWVTIGTMEDYEPSYYRLHQLPLDDYAGHRVRVAFQRFGSGGQYAYINEVGIEVLTQPSVSLQAPASTRTGDTTVMVAEFTSGVLSNPQYTWFSTMEDRGEALILAAADTLKIVYSAPGTDTVTVTLTTDYGTATATAVVDVVDCSPVTSFPWFEGFEHGFDCWEMPTSGLNVWNLRTTGAHSGQNVACASEHDAYNPFDTLVSQPIVVPTDAHGLTLMWWMRHNGGSGPSHFRQMLVKALDATNPVWDAADTLYYGNSTGIPNTWQQFTIDLEPLAGQTVRFAWAGSSYSSSTYIYIDDIEIRYTREPVGSLSVSSARIYGEDTVTATVTLDEGDTVGISYQWESLMADQGLADYVGGGSQMSIAYHGVGIDTIIVVVTNAYGSFTDTTFVRVCPVQDTLPWVADFANDLPCWQVLDGSCDVNNSYGYLSMTDWPTMVVSPPVYVPDNGNVVLEYYCAYSFFYGSTQVMVTTDMTTFDTLSDVPFATGTHPSTRISLGAYAGQHIRVAFKATGQFLQYYLTNVQIRFALEPEVSLSYDSSYFPGTPMTLVATLQEGDTNNLQYTWTSTKTECGEAVLIFDGGPQATLTCYTGGPDTVTVIATNNYGSDTAWCVVNVMPCDTVETLPWVEDFSNQFVCWWQPVGSQWSPDNTGNMACVINAPMSGDNWLISRAITLPTLPTVEGEGMQLWWDAAAIYANHHTYSVWITTGDYRDISSYDTLATFSANLPYYNSRWSTPRVDLSAYAGQTVHLAFRYQTHNYELSSIPGVLAIDNVRILDTRPPEVTVTMPQRRFVDDTVAYRVNHVHGVRSGMSYTWHSTMVQSGLADMYSADTVLYVVYHADGYDTVSLLVANAYGSDSVWGRIQVDNCPAVTVPWYEDFEVTNPCWTGPWAADHITYTWLDSTTRVMYSSPNGWYISPWIDLPDTTGLQLTWRKTAGVSNLMKIFVSPSGGIEYSDFTDTLLLRETSDGLDSVSLDAYAGRRIRVAFGQNASDYYLDSYALDDIRVDYNRTAPQVTLTAPAFVNSGSSVTISVSIGNTSTVGLSYTWHSTLLDSTIVSAGKTLILHYPYSGIDTLTVVVTNAFGSDTAMAVIEVVDCSGITIPWLENFNGIVGTAYNVVGTLPVCWDAVWNSPATNHAPHVVGSTDVFHYSPDNSNSLMLMAGIDGENDSVAYVLLPQVNQPLNTLNLSLWYAYESQNFGQLTLGYMRDDDFVPLTDMPAVNNTGRRDTLSLAVVPDSADRLAFRWTNATIWYTVHIDDICLYEGFPPTVQINGPTSVDAFDTVYYSAQQLGGDTAGLACTWHSSMASRGQAQFSIFNSQFSISYDTIGTDTLTLVAVNAYGADTALLVVDVSWPEDWTHTFTVASADSVMGLVALGTQTASLGTQTVPHGGTVTFRSVALDGYHFVRWSDEVTDVVRTVTVVSDTSFVAYFESDPPDTVWRTVTVTANVEGACEPYGSGIYADGSIVEIGYSVHDTATIGGHWQFLGWDDGGTGNPRSIVVTSDTVLTALFQWVSDTTGGIGETDNPRLKVDIYPNPSHGDVKVSVSEPSTLTLIDMAGRTVIPPTMVDTSFLISHAKLSSGAYFLRVTTSRGTIHRKVVLN